MSNTVLIGMSGGVDSTVSAWLLKNQGYDVIGVTMSIWDGSVPLPDEGKSGCYGPGEARDIAEAEAISAMLGIRHQVIDLKKEYKENVLSYFCSEYLCGKTPNPCVICNQRIKFGFLIEKARLAGINFDKFATGHYARVEFDSTSGRYLLKKAIDGSKDQSYFLSHLKQEQLSSIIFPLGGYVKSEVKKLARSIGLAHLAEKDESQDFIECDDYSVLFNKKDIKPGPILDLDGKKLGTHEGIVKYTIGQRKGLGIGGAKEPLHVLKIDHEKNAIIVGPKKALYSKGLEAKNVNWVSRPAPTTKVKLSAKIRQQHKEAPGVLTPSGDLNNTVFFEFDNPQLSVTPGQTVVFYDNEIVIGGGIIT